MTPDQVNADHFSRLHNCIDELDRRLWRLEADQPSPSPVEPPIGTLGLFWSGPVTASATVIAGNPHRIARYRGRHFTSFAARDARYSDDFGSTWDYFIPLLTFEKELADAGLL